ncbi:hypothetical protein AGMMS49982_09960 [Bacteroidia bacterium]|nr:hypothetical protein AGMMS49982_09960 [Bacteroidia bacterium]
MKKIKTVFKLTEIHIADWSDTQYPVFEVSHPWELGIFSSLKSAESAMLKHIGENDARAEYKDDVYCFFIKEYAEDVLSYSMHESERVYSPTGDLLDECLLSELECEAFFGRPQEKIRFKKGDIVEVLEYDQVELGIVNATPETPERMQERIAYVTEHYPNTRHIFQSDVTDDCYMVYSGDIKDKDEDYHSHPHSCHVFAPRFPIPEDIKNKLIEAYNCRSEV